MKIRPRRVSKDVVDGILFLFAWFGFLSWVYFMFRQ